MNTQEISLFDLPFDIMPSEISDFAAQIENAKNKGFWLRAVGCGIFSLASFGAMLEDKPVGMALFSIATIGTAYIVGKMESEAKKKIELAAWGQVRYPLPIVEKVVIKDGKIIRDRTVSVRAEAIRKKLKQAKNGVMAEKVFKSKSDYSDGEMNVFEFYFRDPRLKDPAVLIETPEKFEARWKKQYESIYLAFISEIASRSDTWAVQYFNEQKNIRDTNVDFFNMNFF